MQQQPRLEFVSCLGSAGLHRMAYWEWGAPDNDKVLVCVHGLTRSGRDFDEVARAMMSEYRVVCPDIVGRGQSDFLHDHQRYTIPFYVYDMVVLLARLNAKTIDWLGTSMGGLIGLGFAGVVEGQELLLQQLPGRTQLPKSTGLRFSKMILNDVGPVIESAAVERIASYVGVGVEYASLEEAIEKTKQRAASFGPMSETQWHRFTESVLVKKGDKWVNHYDLGIADAFAELLDPTVVKTSEALLWNSFKSLQCPVLLIRGEQSDLFSSVTAEQMLAENPRAELFTVPEVGHAPTLMSDEQVAVIRDFLLRV